jgi:hypothetical protein
MRATGRDSWELRVFLGREESGKVRHAQRTFRGSRRAAEREMSRFVSECEERFRQPASRFWAFQWFESGWLLALSVLLIAEAVWLVRRRAT